MPFAVFKNDTSIEGLVMRLFSPDRKLSKTVAKQAAAALLKANPQLEDLSQIPAGSLIAIPDAAPPVVSTESVQAPAKALAAQAARVQQLVQSLAIQLSALDDRTREAADSLLDLAKTKDTRQGTEDLPDLTEVLPFTKKPSQTVVKDLEKTLKSRDEAVADLIEHIAFLMGTNGAKKDQ